MDTAVIVRGDTAYTRMSGRPWLKTVYAAMQPSG